MTNQTRDKADAPSAEARRPRLPDPPPGAAADWTVPQHWDELTAEDHWVWDTLFARQQTLLHGRSVHAFEEGLDVLAPVAARHSDFDELNERLSARTGWTVVAVPGLVPDDVFFAISPTAASRPATSSARPGSSTIWRSPTSSTTCSATSPCSPSPAVADFMQASASSACAALELGQLHRLARLYWYTVEFGLAREAGRAQIYGAGILSSFGECRISRSKAPSPTGRLRSRARAPHPLPDRHLPAGLLRHRPISRTS